MAEVTVRRARFLKRRLRLPDEPARAPSGAFSRGGIYIRPEGSTVPLFRSFRALELSASFLNILRALLLLKKSRARVSVLPFSAAYPF